MEFFKALSHPFFSFRPSDKLTPWVPLWLSLLF
jgi:hypothetical protein